MDVMKKIREVMKLRSMRFVHVSTGPGYVPRSSRRTRWAPSPEQKGVTYNVGRNRQKRAKRWLARANLPV